MLLLQLFNNNPKNQFNHTKSLLPVHHLPQCRVLPPIQLPSRQQEVKLTLRHLRITGKCIGSSAIRNSCPLNLGPKYRSECLLHVQSYTYEWRNQIALNCTWSYYYCKQYSGIVQV